MELGGVRVGPSDQIGLLIERRSRERKEANGDFYERLADSHTRLSHENGHKAAVHCWGRG